MEQRDYIIVGLIVLLIMQHYKIWKLSKETFLTKVSMLALMRWLDEVHKIKPPDPDKDASFEKIVMELKSDDFIIKQLND